jgi:predicted RNase H-like nuclease (RuvC/YqgF family)
MSDTKQKVSVYVEKEHLARAKDAGYTSPTAAINKGLELLMDMITEDVQRTHSGRIGDVTGDTTSDVTEEDVGHMADNIGHITDVIADNGGRNEEVIENAVLKARIEEYEKHFETLKTELDRANKDKEDLKDQLKSNDENQLLRITDLKEEISVLSNELTNRNDTIKNLTTITESQIKGYKLIEAPGAKKPWWKFW